MKRLLPSLFILFSLLLVSSCATVSPPPERPSVVWIGALPPESTFFVSVNITSSREIIGDIFTEAEIDSLEIQKILNRTKRIYAGIYLAPLNSPSFSLISLGNYPSSMVRFPLIMSRNWHRVKYSMSYWQHAEMKLQVAFPERNLILVSNGAMERMLVRLQNPVPYPFPDEVYREIEHMDFLIFFPVLPTASKSSNLEKLPIKAVWVYAEKKQEFYEMVGVFTLTEEKDTRLLQFFFRLIITAWMRKAGMEDLVQRLKEMEITVREKCVRISGLRFSKKEIANTLGLLLKVEEGDG